MSIFGAIKKAIFGDNGPLGGQFGGKPAQPQPGGPVAGQANTAPHAPAQPQPGTGVPKQQGAQPATPASPTPAAPAAPTASVDVEKLLSDKAAGQQSDWRHSIVDLLKLLGLDSSLTARKELAQELGVQGEAGTAETNIALHKAVMRKLAENGGKVPADMLD
jgi:hypothetical protein